MARARLVLALLVLAVCCSTLAAGAASADEVPDEDVKYVESFRLNGTKWNVYRRISDKRSWFVHEPSGKSQWGDPRRAVAAAVSGGAALTALMAPFLVLLLAGGAYTGYIVLFQSDKLKVTKTYNKRKLKK